MLESKKNSSPSLNYLNNFLESFNNLDDMRIDDLISGFQNHPFNQEGVDFLTKLENDFSSIEKEFENNIINFLNEYSEVKFEDFDNLEDLRSTLKSTKIYQFLYDFSTSSIPRNSIQISYFYHKLKPLMNEVLLKTKKSKSLILKAEFLVKFKNAIEFLAKDNTWQYRSNTIIHNVYKEKLKIINDINNFIKAVDKTSDFFDYEIYYNPKTEKFSSFNTLDSLKIGTISIGYDCGKISNFQKDWKNKQMDLKKVLTKHLKTFLSRKYKFIVSTISSKSVKWIHIKDQKIPLCLLTEEELEENLKQDFEFLSIYDITKLFTTNSIDEVDKVLNIVKKIAIETNEFAVKDEERKLYKWN